MKKFQITWKHSELNTKGEVQNLVPPQAPLVIEADNWLDAEDKFREQYPALYIHNTVEVN